VKHVWTITKRELRGYFTTPVAYVFIVIFLMLSGVFTFYMGGFYDRDQADLRPFFMWHPYLYLFLVPAISMRLWSEERKTGSIELLMTLPVTIPQAVLGKFLAAWLFCGITLALTFPVWLTVAYLGDPDHGTILAGYLGSLLMAGGFLSIGAAVSALTKNQVIAFVISIVICLMFLLAQFPMVLNFFRLWAPDVVVEQVTQFSFQAHFSAIMRGVIDLRDVIFFATLIAFFLFANGLILDQKKAD
jgi:ABC-2 type transport system permease protein